MRRLKELRLQKRLRQEDLGKLFGATKSAVSMWESGKREPDKDTIVALAEYFGVTVDYLLGREDPTTYDQLASRAQEEADWLGAEIMRQVKALPEDSQRHLLEKWQGEIDFLRSLDKNTNTND